MKPPEIHGDPAGDLLIVGWGSTLGAIEDIRRPLSGPVPGRQVGPPLPAIGERHQRLRRERLVA